jgi:hypothetical protein
LELIKSTVFLQKYDVNWLNCCCSLFNFCKKILLNGYFKNLYFSKMFSKFSIVTFTVFNYNKLLKKHYTCLFMAYRIFQFELPSFNGLRVITFKAKNWRKFRPATIFLFYVPEKYPKMLHVLTTFVTVYYWRAGNLWHFEHLP